MAITPNFSITQSSSGLIGTVNDLFNYGSESGIVVTDFTSRHCLILDSNGDVFTTVNFIGDSLTATFTIGKINLWANATMAWTGDDNYNKTLEFPLGRVTYNLYRTLLKKGCCDQNTLVEQALNAADRFLRGAEDAAPSGNSSEWQQDIDAAYSYLNQYPS